MEDADLLLVAGLIVLTGFFVAAEFAIVNVRLPKIERLVESGNKRAVYVKKILNHLDNYLFACQFGITLTALGLGWLGERLLVPWISSLFHGVKIDGSIAFILSFLIAFFVVAYVRVVIGELIPQAFAVQKAEKWILFTAKPLLIFYNIMFPVIWLFQNSAHAIMRFFQLKPVKQTSSAHSEEDIKLILSESYKNGTINDSEITYLYNIFEFDERLVKEIMVPRTEMVCLYKNEPFEKNRDLMLNGLYTRYPVADGDKDNIIGLINIKEVFAGLLRQEKPISIHQYIRPILHVSETMPIKELLLKMQTERIHMAIVIDEYGGTAGLVTVEDILEEIVGEIRDEIDRLEIPLFEQENDYTFVVSGKIQIDDLNELLGLDIDSTDFDTISGWIYMQNVDATEGTVVEYGGYQFIVEKVEGYQIKKVRIIRLEQQKQQSII